MITAILIISLANLVLQVIAVIQRHQTLQVHRKNGAEE
jgi:hypothetical protein